jgi:serine/threonine protein kinase
MKIASHHPNIIRFYGVTKLQGKGNNYNECKKFDYSISLTYFLPLDKPNHSIVFVHADGGSLENYLKTNADIFKWEIQLRFAKEIADAVSWLYHKKVIHGDIVSINYIRSFKERLRYNTYLICSFLESQ